MRTFHTGGIAGKDITSGLPRVEELFEARSPKGKARIAEIDGYVLVFEGAQLAGEPGRASLRRCFSPLRRWRPSFVS